MRIQGHYGGFKAALRAAPAPAEASIFAKRAALSASAAPLPRMAQPLHPLANEKALRFFRSASIHLEFQCLGNSGAAK